MEFVVGYGGQDITLQTKGCTYIGIVLIGFDCNVVLPYVSLAGSFKNNNKIFKTAISEWNSRNLRILPTLEIFLIIRKGSMLPLFMYIFTIYPQSTTLQTILTKSVNFIFHSPFQILDAFVKQWRICDDYFPISGYIYDLGLKTLNCRKNQRE